MNRIFRIFLVSLLPTFAICQPAPSISDTAPPEVELKLIPVPSAEVTARNPTVSRITDLSQIPDDFWTHGTYGDLLLSNDFASFVFGAVPEKKEEQNQTRQGSVIDIFQNPSSTEYFQLIQPTTDVRGSARSLLANLVDYEVNEQEGRASVTVFADDITTEGLTVDSNFEMRKSWPGVMVTTTITNNSRENRLVRSFADFCGWGSMGVFASGNGWIKTIGGIVPDTEFVFGRLHDSIVYIQPIDTLMEVRFNLGQTTLIYSNAFTLAPGESRSFKRWLLVGRDDPGKLYSFVSEQRGRDKFGYIAGTIHERSPLPDGGYIESGVAANAEVRLAVVKRPDLPTTYAVKPYIYTITDSNGHYQVSVPEGEYLLSPFKYSRVYQPGNLGTRAGKPGTVTAVDLIVSKASTLVYEIVDAETGKPLPGKITLQPLRGTSEVYLGAPGTLQAVDTIYSAIGKGIVEVPLGQFRLVASHGNEYQMEERRMNIEPLKSHTVRFEMRRAFTPKGWISADLGVLTNRSPQSRVTPEDRVVTAAAEGLSWIVTADPGEPTDLQPMVDRLGLTDTLRASSGFRLTSTAEHAPGDYILFPLELCSSGATTDFSRVLSADNPKDAIEQMQALCPAGVLMANRPIFPSVGVLSILGYDHNVREVPVEGGTLAVDAFQVWDGKRQPIVMQAYDAWMRLVELGGRFTPVGNSLSSGTVGEEVGYPRVYIQSSETNPRKLDVGELARNIKQGKVLITNGPFIDMKVNGAPPGEIVTPRDNIVEVELEVYTPNWANVSAITINLNGQLSRKIILPAGSFDPEQGIVYPLKDKPEDKLLKITVTEDSVMTVIVDGDPQLAQDPVNPQIFGLLSQPGSGAPRGQYSTAIAPAVFIDFDGDGLVKPRLAPMPKTGEEKGPYVPPF